MPSNHKGKGTKGRGFDAWSGVGTSRAGPTGTTGNLNDAGHDGGVGTPDLGDAGNLQSVQRGEPGDTPALGRSHRGPAGNRQGEQAPGEPHRGTADKGKKP